jgi:uncharacterized protein YheU (UPF0270 family)
VNVGGSGIDNKIVNQIMESIANGTAVGIFSQQMETIQHVSQHSKLF